LLTGYDRNWQALERAVAVAISRGALKPSARRWGKIDLLEEMARIVGSAPTKLRNQYYRNDPRLAQTLLDYAAADAEGAIASLRALEFRRYSPIVWKRPRDQLRASRDSLPETLHLLRVAEEQMRQSADAPIDLRREIGTVAAEVMACALTFFDGQARWSLLSEGDRLFRSAMGFLSLGHEFTPADAALFARFWENAATRCGLEWSNIWDDPRLPPTIGSEVVVLAMNELERASDWVERHGGGDTAGEQERIRQFSTDKAKWLVKAGRFDEAWRLLDALEENSDAHKADRLLIATLERIVGGDLRNALRIGSRLAEQLGSSTESIAPTTTAMMVHNIELMRDNETRLPDDIVAFLRESPVAGSEHINLPRYRERLRGLGYAEVAA